MKDIVLVAVILLILGGAALYIYKAKKRGEVCVGCPYARECAKKRHACACGESKGK